MRLILYLSSQSRENSHKIQRTSGSSLRSEKGTQGAAEPTAPAYMSTPRSACYGAGAHEGERLTAAKQPKTRW